MVATTASLRAPEAAETNSPAPALRASYLAPDLIVRGRLESPGTVEVDGLVEGDLKAGHAVIAPLGRVKATLEAEDATISGNLAGIIKARSVTFTDGCHFQGEIQYERLGCEPDANLEATFIPVVGADARPYVPGVKVRTRAGRRPSQATARPQAPPSPRPPSPRPTATHSGTSHRWVAAIAWIVLLGAGFAAGLMFVSPATKDWRASLLEALREGRASAPPTADAPETSVPVQAPAVQEVPAEPSPPPAAASSTAPPKAPPDTPAPAPAPAPSQAAPAPSQAAPAKEQRQPPSAAAPKDTTRETPKAPRAPAPAAAPRPVPAEPSPNTPAPANPAPTKQGADEPAVTPPAKPTQTTQPSETIETAPRPAPPPPVTEKPTPRTPTAPTVTEPRDAPSKAGASTPETPAAKTPEPTSPKDENSKNEGSKNEAPKEDTPQAGKPRSEGSKTGATAPVPAAPDLPVQTPRAAPAAPAAPAVDDDGCSWNLQCDDKTGRCVSVRECRAK